RVLRGLQRHANQPEALDAALRALGAIGIADDPNPELLGAWQEFVRDDQQARRLSDFLKVAQESDLGRATVAYAVFISVEKQPRIQERQKREVKKVLDEARSAQPLATSAWLRAVGRLREQGAAAEVRSFLPSTNTSIAAAAKFAARELNLDRS